MTLYSDAADGVLTPSTLQRYGTHLIDAVDQNSTVTPLIAAIRAGQTKSVKVLLDGGAAVDKTSPDGRTPLFWATWEKNAPNRVDIVRTLLEANPKPEVDLTSNAVGNNTPLMNAILKLKNPQVISMLVDAGANTQAQNKKKQNPAKLAEMTGDPRLSRSLRSKFERNAPTAETINGIVRLVLHVVAFTGLKTLEGMVQGVANKVFEFTGEYDTKIEKEIEGPEKPPESVEEYHDKIKDYIVDKKLGKFFKPNDDFLQKVAQNAMALRNDTSTPLSKPENIERLVKLSLYKPMIYCDDSGSMGNVKDPKSRAASQLRLVTRMTRISTRIVPDKEGVDLFFIHADGTVNAKEKKVEQTMLSKGPGGGTPIGTVLKQKILNPFVYKVINSSSGQFQRPLLISILTDGGPSGEENDDNKAFEKAIFQCTEELRKKGYPEHAVIFQISQVGDDSSARDFLKQLAKRSENDKSLYCTTQRLDDKLSENEYNLEEWLLKLLVAPISRALPGEEEETL